MLILMEQFYCTSFWSREFTIYFYFVFFICNIYVIISFISTYLKKFGKKLITEDKKID